jgi:hypothetical protein
MATKDASFILGKKEKLKRFLAWNIHEKNEIEG